MVVEVQVKPQAQEVLPSRQVQGLVVHAEEPQEHPQEVHHHHPGKAQGLGVHL